MRRGVAADHTHPGCPKAAYHLRPPNHPRPAAQANELLHGRLAMLGFAAALINEGSTGLGPLGQVRALTQAWRRVHDRGCWVHALTPREVC